MPKLTVEGVGEFEVPQGMRLVLAMTQVAGVDQLHACGGKSRCTTCKVEFVSGEPQRITTAERDILAARGLSGVRLSCQILCEQDMTVRAISRFEGSGRKDAGGPPASEIEPPPVWVDKN
jgi:ferredoxin